MSKERSVRPFCFEEHKWLTHETVSESEANNIADEHHNETGHRTDVIHTGEIENTDKNSLMADETSISYRPYCEKQGWLGPKMSRAEANAKAKAHRDATGHRTDVIHLHS